MQTPTPDVMWSETLWRVVDCYTARELWRGMARTEQGAMRRARAAGCNCYAHNAIACPATLDALRPTDAVRDASDPDPDPILAAFDASVRDARTVAKREGPATEPDDVLLRDGTVAKLVDVPAGVEYWHDECSPPGDHYGPNDDDDCLNCGAKAGEVCKPIGRGTAKRNAMQAGMFDPSATCEGSGGGCGAGPGEPCKPTCRWAYGENAAVPASSGYNPDETEGNDNGH